MTLCLVCMCVCVCVCVCMCMCSMLHLFVVNHIYCYFAGVCVYIYIHIYVFVYFAGVSVCMCAPLGSLFFFFRMRFAGFRGNDLCRLPNLLTHLFCQRALFVIWYGPFCKKKTHTHKISGN